MVPTTIEKPQAVRTPQGLSPAGILLYSLANFGFGAFYALNNFILPPWIEHYVKSAAIRAILSDSHSFEGALIQPVIGAWSDRLRSRFGRRRPFLLVCVPISAAFILATPATAHLPDHVRLAAMIACIMLFTIAFNIAADPYQAWLADVTTQDQRDKVSGLWYFIGVLGQVGILLIPAPLSILFVIVAVTMLVTTLVTCVSTPEPPPPAMAHVEGGVKQHYADLMRAMQGLQTLRQARLYLGMYFLFGAGIGAIQPHLSLFIVKIGHCSTSTALHVVMALFLTAAIAAVPGGLLAAKIGVKHMLVVGTTLIGIASLGGMWVHSLPQIVGVLVVAGLGMAAQNSSSFPLMTRLVPTEEVGYYSGLQTTALCIALPGSAVGTGWLIDHSSYRVIFVMCFVCIVLSAAVLSRIQEDEADPEIAARRVELAREAVIG